VEIKIKKNLQNLYDKWLISISKPLRMALMKIVDMIEISFGDFIAHLEMMIRHQKKTLKKMNN